MAKVQHSASWNTKCQFSYCYALGRCVQCRGVISLSQASILSFF